MFRGIKMRLLRRKQIETAERLSDALYQRERQRLDDSLQELHEVQVADTFQRSLDEILYGRRDYQ